MIITGNQMDPYIHVYSHRRRDTTSSPNQDTNGTHRQEEEQKKSTTKSYTMHTQTTQPSRGSMREICTQDDRKLVIPRNFVSEKKGGGEGREGW